MKKLFIIIFVLLLTGCTSISFSIKEIDNRFDEDKNIWFLSEGNRISKRAIAGGVHFDSKGVYINPFVSKDATGKICLLGLHIINRTEYNTTYGKINQLGQIEKIVFIISNKTLYLPVVNQKSRKDDTFYYNPSQKYISYDKQESGDVYLTRKQFRLLANSINIKCKISGTNQSVIYKEKDIMSDFIVNLNTFYTKHIIPF